jgi:hypothetical protein
MFDQEARLAHKFVGPFRGHHGRPFVAVVDFGLFLVVDLDLFDHESVFQNVVKRGFYVVRVNLVVVFFLIIGCRRSSQHGCRVFSFNDINVDEFVIDEVVICQVIVIDQIVVVYEFFECVLIEVITQYIPEFIFTDFVEIDLRYCHLFVFWFEVVVVHGKFTQTLSFVAPSLRRWSAGAYMGISLNANHGR